MTHSPPVDRDLDHQITELNREIGYRVHVYPPRIANGKLDEHDARTRMKRLRGAVETLENLRDQQRPTLDLPKPHRGSSA